MGGCAHRANGGRRVARPELWRARAFPKIAVASQGILATLEHMALTHRKPADSSDLETAESGVVEITQGGVTHRGSYRVRAEGRGRQRYAMTPNKHVTVSYLGHNRGTAIGESGLELITSMLLSELVHHASAR